MTGPSASALHFFFVFPTFEKCQRMASRRDLISRRIKVSPTYPDPSKSFRWLTKNPDLGTRPIMAAPEFLFFVCLGGPGGEGVGSNTEDMAPAPVGRRMTEGGGSASALAPDTAATASTIIPAARRIRRRAGETGSGTQFRCFRRGDTVIAGLAVFVFAFPEEVRAAFAGRTGVRDGTAATRPFALS